MSFVGKVDYDVFLSYAHGNDDLRNWSLGVERMLANALNTHLADRASELKLFTDADRLQGNGFIDPQLKPAVQSSAALVIIMTEHYVKSPSCLDEASWYLEKAKPDSVFVIRAQNVAADE